MSSLGLFRASRRILSKVQHVLGTAPAGSFARQALANDRLAKNCSPPFYPAATRAVRVRKAMAGAA